MKLLRTHPVGQSLFFATSHISEVHVWGCGHLFSSEKKKAAGRSESLFENHCLQVVQSVLIDLNTYWIGFTECIATVI